MTMRIDFAEMPTNRKITAPLKEPALEREW